MPFKSDWSRESFFFESSVIMLRWFSVFGWRSLKIKVILIPKVWLNFCLTAAKYYFACTVVQSRWQKCRVLFFFVSNGIVYNVVHVFLNLSPSCQVTLGRSIYYRTHSNLVASSESQFHVQYSAFIMHEWARKTDMTACTVAPIYRGHRVTLSDQRLSYLMSLSIHVCCTGGQCIATGTGGNRRLFV